MRALVWPMLDNKFLKQPGFGLKMLLPSELVAYMEKEDRDFYQRARLDKQNMIPSLEWSGESLYDLANARVKCCGAERRAAQAPRSARRLDHRPAADRSVPHAARPAAPVQVPLPPARRPLPRPHRRKPALENRPRNLRSHARRLPPRPGRRRPRTAGRLSRVLAVASTRRFVLDPFRAFCQTPRPRLANVPRIGRRLAMERRVVLVVLVLVLAVAGCNSSSTPDSPQSVRAAPTTATAPAPNTAERPPRPGRPRISRRRGEGRHRTGQLAAHAAGRRTDRRERQTLPIAWPRQLHIPRRRRSASPAEDKAFVQCMGTDRIDRGPGRQEEFCWLMSMIGDRLADRRHLLHGRPAEDADDLQLREIPRRARSRCSN